MNQPIGSYTEADFEHVLARDYPAESIPAAKALLERYGSEDLHPGILRVRMACLKLADGDLASLEGWVGLACLDYRDVLSPAEYPTYSRARTPEAKEQAIERDWNQLQAWLHREKGRGGTRG